MYPTNECLRACVTYGLGEVDTNLFENLLDNFVALFFDTDIHGVVNSVIHHLLSLLHDIVLALKFHGDAL